MYPNLASADKKVLGALIYLIRQYPFHTRYAILELMEKSLSYCISIWLNDALKVHTPLLQEVVAIGDQHGRSKLLNVVQSFHPTYSGYMGEPINTVWGHPTLPENWKE